MTETSRPHPDPALVLERVELAFPGLLPGFRVEERQVCFDGQVVADLLARAGGRTFLISLVGEDEDAAALRALDSLSFARTRSELLADYLPGEAFAGNTPEVVLVAGSFSARLRARLAALSGDADFWLAVRHDLSTARGSLTRLERADEGPQPTSRPAGIELPGWATEEPLRGFLAQIAPDRLGLALETVDRIRRIDPGLRWTAGEGLDLACRLDEAALCRLAWTDGHLELQLEEGGVPHAIRDEGAIDFVLDWVLTCFLELVEARAQQPADDPLPEAPRAEPQAGPPDLDGAELDELDDLDALEEPDEPDESGLSGYVMRPEPPQPLLSEEEIQAFLE